jgi:DivIVA domain-containing protein
MVNTKLTPKDIYEADFAIKMRGYDKDEVDELLDDVMVDYESYASELLRLQEENEFLKKKVVELERRNVQPNAANFGETQRVENLSELMKAEPTPEAKEEIIDTMPKIEEKKSFSDTQPMGASNFELLKRINHLEQVVFGPEGLVNKVKSL